MDFFWTLFIIFMTIFWVIFVPVLFSCFVSPIDKVSIFRRKYTSEKELIDKHREIYTKYLSQISENSDNLEYVVILCLNEIMVSENLKKFKLTENMVSSWENSPEVPEVLKKLKKTLSEEFLRKKIEFLCYEK